MRDVIADLIGRGVEKVVIAYLVGKYGEIAKS